MQKVLEIKFIGVTLHQQNNKPTGRVPGKNTKL